MTCNDCKWCGECIMSAPDGNWAACKDFVERSEEGKMTDKQREGVLDWIEHFATMLEADYLEQDGMLEQRCFDDIMDWLRDLELTVSDEEPQDTMNIVQVQFYSTLADGRRYTFRIPKGVKVKKGEYLKDPKGYLVRATADSIELPTELIETWIMGGRKVTADIVKRLKEERLDSGDKD